MRYISHKLVFAACACLVLLLPMHGVAQTVVVQPYIQPGDGRLLTGSDVKAVCWWTDQQPGDFIVEYQMPGSGVRSVKPARVTLDFAALKTAPKLDAELKGEKVPQPKEQDQHYFKYTAYLEALPFNTDVKYHVKLGNNVIRAATFRTRATADKSVRCIMVGDMAYGMAQEKTIAYQIGMQKPDFLVALGDIVYPSGRLNQYMNHYWSTYNNVTQPSAKTGAPLMATIPFYPLLGNHDVSAKLPAVPDALAAYYVFCPPKGGPGEGPWVTQLGKDTAVAAKFRAATADSYPNLDAYSFDYGPAHIVVLNVNKGMATDAPAFRQWLRDDLMATKATWKIVCYHMPAFHSSTNHYTDQQVRPLQPLFEECSVDLTFAGHVHNYQRTVPLKFATDGVKDKKGKVNGKFTLDTAFDGVKNTRANGVIHVVAGGGGARLYGPAIDKTAPKIKKDHGDNYADYTAKMIVEEHSFVVLDLAPGRLDLRAIGLMGTELDRITITKGK
ncbi:MAG TPA: metallophosphoesterase [Gemmataceae bacterium]|nr:metallophosphoesterase [Gemmataceae bacterium]